MTGSEDPRLARFRTGQALRGGLLQALVSAAGAGSVLPTGSLMGPWRLLRLIASGGMSHVYLAERADGQFEQQVALKLVRHNPDLLGRLRHERQLIATLRHPHIVSLVDGGETADGDLWFAMALIDGAPIDAFANDRGLDWRRRLALFDQVCAAVGYAHSRGLIHRDLKPANILVDAHGHPRLLDFGIAIEGELEDGRQDHVLTPGYASPEQKSGGAITTASDLFQLGLVLRALMPDALVMPARVARDLRELVARATATRAEDRHASAAAMREDVQAILDGRVLHSDRDDPWLRAVRFAGRHRAALAIAALAILALAAVLATAAWQLRMERNQALANARRAEAVTGFLVDTLGQANPYSGQGTEASILDAMDLAAATLDERLADAPEVRRQLRGTIGSVYMNLDEPRRCLAVVASSVAAADLSEATPEEVASAHVLRSECHLVLDEREAAWAWLESAERALDGHAGGAADRLRAWILIDKGQLLSLNGSLEEANVLLRQALPLAEGAGAGEQAFRAYRFLGGNLQNANRSAEATEMLAKAHAKAAETLGPGHRSALTLAGQLAVVLGRQKRFDEARRLVDEALATARAVKHRDGAADIVIAQLLDNQATLHWEQGNFAACIPSAREAVAIYRRAAAPGSSQGFNPSWRSATCAYQSGDWAAASTFAGEALGFARDGVPVGVVNAQRMLAAAAVRQGRIDEAQRHLDAAQASARTTEIANPAVGAALALTEALLAHRRGDGDAARGHLAEADATIAAKAIQAPWLLQERAAIAADLGTH